MNETERFAALVARGDDTPLDEAALCIAAHAYPGLEVDRWLARLDELAAACPARDFEALAAYCFDELAFAGNADDYGDPRNSYLNDVLTRRVGIPITLSVVMMEIGRRVGVDVIGIGMPGHFIVRAGPDPHRFCDPFARGRLLDPDGCRAVFHRVAGDTPFRSKFLDPAGPTQILARMLANLQRVTLQRGRRDAVWVARLRSRVPGLTTTERRELATVLGSLGAFTEAATELELLAAEVPHEEEASGIAIAATAMRARTN